MYDPEKLRNILILAVRKVAKELHSAAGELEKPTVPRTPLPSPPEGDLGFAGFGLCWPYIEAGGGVQYQQVTFTNMVGKAFLYEQTVANTAAQACGFQPARVLAAIEVFQAATAWCQAKIEERKKEAVEIVRRQLSQLRMLEAMVGEKVWEGPEEEEFPKKKSRRVLQV